MLKIRKEQFEAFEQAAWRNFEDEMVAHSREFSAPLCQIIGEEQLRVALRQAMDRAQSYGFTNRGPIRLYIELMFLCGSDFDTDPQYPALGELLRSPGDQMQRAERIHEGHLEYLEKVSGPGAVNVHKALTALAVLAQQPPEFASSSFTPTMLRYMTEVFPQKAAYVGERRLTILINEGRAEAQRRGFSTPRAEALVVILMFAFGHGCTADPLYPWIAQTLKDERIKDPAARAVRLEKKAITWLDHVVARFQGGAES